MFMYTVKHVKIIKLDRTAQQDDHVLQNRNMKQLEEYTVFCLYVFCLFLFFVITCIPFIILLESNELRTYLIALSAKAMFCFIGFK